MKMPDRPRGALIEDWQPRLAPDDRLLFGAEVAVEPLDVARHAPALWQAFAPDTEGALWDYLGYGPFANETELAATYEQVAGGRDPKFYAFIPKSSRRAEGVASFMRIAPEHGVIEIGHICLAPSMQHTRAATEALFLIAAARAGRTGLPAAGMEVRCPQPALAAGGGTAGLHLRGHFSPSHGDQGPQPRYRLVRHHRRGLAAPAPGVQPLAGGRQFRRRRSADQAAGGVSPG